jgi:hypothetical protein
MTEASGTTNGVPPAPSSSTRATFKDLAGDALRYWEARRPLYNSVLAFVVLCHFVSNWPASRSILTFDAALGFFLLAVLANICYCAAYAVDLFVQFSGMRSVWPKWRWLVLCTGTAFAAVIAHFFAKGIFTPGAD